MSLITELSNAYGHRFDSFLDFFLSHTLGMAGQTKKLVATASQATASVLITNSAYHHKTIQLICQTAADKIVSARQFGATHVATFVRVHACPSKHAIEASGGLDDLEKCLRRGLEDANPVVKENMRVAFWEAEGVWPEVGARVMDGLDAKSRKQLEAARAGAGKVAGKGVAGAKPGAAKAARPTMREQMMHAKAKKEAEEAAAAAEAAGATPEQATQTTVAELPSVATGGARMATAGTPIRARPSNAGSGLGSSTRRDSHPGSPPSSIPQPRSPRQSRPSGPKPTPTGDNDSLLDYSSPFRNDGPDPSLDFADSPSANRKASAPVAEVVVPEALRDQAAQAEQAAQRLLELGDSESEADGQHTPLGPGGQAVESGGRKGQSWAQRTPITKRYLAGDVFEDSPDPRNGASGAQAISGKTNWWANRLMGQSTAEPAAPLSSEREAEIDQLIGALEVGQIDKAGLAKLAALSRERPTCEAVVDGVVHASDSAAEFWDGEGRFTRVYEGLSKLLTSSGQTEETVDAALNALRMLVENQFSAFAGDEAGLVGLLFKLRENPSRTSTAATDCLAASLAAQIEPLLGLGLALSALAALGTPTASLSAGEKRAYALGLAVAGRCFAQLPREVAQEEFPRARGVIWAALSDRESGDLRRGAVECLTEVNAVVGEGEWVVRAMEGLQPSQLNLLSYYFSKFPAGLVGGAPVG